MANAREITVDTLIDEANYELRNTPGVQFIDAEMLVYYNKAREMIEQILVEANLDLTASGSGTITTVAGTEAYDLSANSMGDFWAPYRLENYENTYAIYLTDASSNVYEPLDMVPYEERFQYVVGGSSDRSQPEGFYLFGVNIGLLPIPDAVYTVTIPAYFPNFVPTLTANTSTETVPYQNLFNQQIVEAMKLLAKNRQNYPTAVDAALLELFQDRAHAIANRRRKEDVRLKVRKR